MASWCLPKALEPGGRLRGLEPFMTAISGSTSPTSPPWLATLKSFSSARSSSNSVLSSANTALFSMSSLTPGVRTMARVANSLRDDDTKGIASMRKQVVSMMEKFDSISTAAGGTAQNEKDTDKVATMNAAQLRTTISDMQTNLQSNIRKVGVSIQKSLTYSAQDSQETLAQTWARLYGN
jgi:hypothetical protein